MHKTVYALAVMMLAGCATQPTSAPAPTPTSTSTPAAAVAAVATPNVVAGTAAEQKKAPPGYKYVKRDGQVFYCKETSQIGTRFTKTTCMTPDEFAEYEREGAAAQQELQRRMNTCPTGNCSR